MRPIVHQLAALGEEIATTIGSLGLALGGGVRERHLDRLGPESLAEQRSLWTQAWASGGAQGRRFCVHGASMTFLAGEGGELNH